MGNISIVNVVGGGAIYRELDLLQIFRDFPHSKVEYNPDSFAAVVIRYDSPEGTMMLYNSGKYSLAGAKSVDGAREVNKIFIEELEQMLHEEVKKREFEVRYLVGTADTGTDIDLNRMHLSLGINHVEYEPEQFSGLFYRPSNQNWFCILFSTGKVVFSGVRDEKELKNAYDEIYKKIRNC